MQREESYPVRFSVDYPDRPLDRLTTAFRIVVAIPILIVLTAVAGGGGWDSSYDTTRTTTIAAAGLLVFGPLLLILFRQKYRRWWFDWNLELQRFGNRVGAYLALLDDRYPATNEHQSVHLDYPYPDVERDLNRWLPLVRVGRLPRPHREPGRPDRRLCQRQPGAGERARSRSGAAPGGDLRRAGPGAAGGHRPAGAGAGGPPGVTSDASAWSRRGPPNPAGRAGSAATGDHARTYDPNH
jgi:hypothetical protein